MTIYVDWENKKVLGPCGRANWIEKESDRLFMDDYERERLTDNYLAFAWRMNPTLIEMMSDETREIIREGIAFEQWVDDAAQCAFDDNFEEIEIE